MHLLICPRLPLFAHAPTSWSAPPHQLVRPAPPLLPIQLPTVWGARGPDIKSIVWARAAQAWAPAPSSCVLTCLSLSVPWERQEQRTRVLGRTVRGLQHGEAFVKLGYLGPTCLHSSNRTAEETVRKKEEGESDWGLELEEKEEPSNHAQVASASP